MSKEGGERSVVLSFMPNYAGGGAEKMARLFMKALEPHFRIYFAQAYSKEELKVPDWQPEHFVSFEKRKCLFSFFSLYKLRKKINPNVVFSSLGTANLLLLLQKVFFRKQKVVLRYPNTLYFKGKRVESSLLELFTVKWLYRFADLVITQTKEMREQMIELAKIESGKVICIPNIIDKESIIERAKEPITFDKDSSEVSILYPGRVTVDKGALDLLEAFSGVVQSSPEFKLYILGQIPVSEEGSLIRNRLKDLNLEQKVSFLGWKSNPYPYMKHADLIVLAGRREGVPNALLEALVLAKPVVVTDCFFGVHDLVQDTVNAFVVPVQKPDLLAKAILNFRALKPYESDFEDSRQLVLKAFQNLLRSNTISAK